jgi:uncharacterized phiE125 gp8 family phage protein
VNRAWSRSIEPLQEPYSLTDVKLHCRALTDIADENPIIQLYLKAARRAFEEYTGTTAFTTTWVLTQDGFCNPIELPHAAPLQSISSVKYYDTDGTQQTLSTSYYRADTASTPGRVVLKPSQAWPDVQADRGQAVEVTYVAGWATVAGIPANAKIGMLMLIDHLHENRGAVQVGVGVGAIEVPKGVEWWWAPYRQWAA